MICIEAEKGQVCNKCGKPFKKGELIFKMADGCIVHGSDCSFANMECTSSKKQKPSRQRVIREDTAPN